eukprot:m.1249312 g.1249312  ORF g.1249312 m.1249312 type:complete len:443 (+) comp24701_c0_seq36:443-1771(+)
MCQPTIQGKSMMPKSQPSLRRRCTVFIHVLKKFPIETCMISAGLLLITFSVWPEFFPGIFSEDVFDEDDATSGGEIEDIGSLAHQFIDVPVCVNNPIFHYSHTGVWVPECQTIVAEQHHKAWPTRSFILNLDGHEPRFDERRSFLEKHGINLERFPAVDGRIKFADDYKQVVEYDTKTGEKHVQMHWVKKGPEGSVVLKPGDRGYLTMGERGYLASMRAVLKMAYADESCTSIMVIDDDAVFSCNFGSDLTKLLSEPRCGACASDNISSPAVMLLGVATWTEGTYPQLSPWTGGKNILDEDRRMYSESFGMTTHCTNHNDLGFGSFGVIYHRTAIPVILKWLEHDVKPFDHVFGTLAGQGVFVRVANPYITIQDVRHTSNIDPNRKNQEDLVTRAKIHDWDLKSFCAPDGTRILKEETSTLNGTTGDPDTQGGGAGNAPPPL